MISKKEWKDAKKKVQILRQAAEVFRVEDRDLVKTIERFKRETEEMKKRKTDA